MPLHLPPTPPSTANQYRHLAARPFAASQALPDHLIALPPLSSPLHSPRDRPTTPQPSFDDAYSITQPKDDARSRYRSWREGKPVLGGRVAPGFEDVLASSRAVIDKKIEATLPRAEQSANARSRKTSYYLGIFKENEATQDPKASARQRSRPDVDRSTAGSAQQEDIVSNQPQTSDGDRQALPASRDAAIEQVSKPRDGPNLRSATDNLDQRTRIHAVPPGGEKSLERSVTSNTLSKEQPSVDAKVHTGLQGLAGIPEENVDSNVIDISKTIRQGSLTDDEEIDTEHISSAVYFPHHTLEQRPHLKERKSAEVLDEIEHGRQARAIEALPIHQPRSRSQDDQTAGEIEFSLQSADESHYLHGDIQAITTIPEEILNAKRGSLATESASSASASGSETDYSEDLSEEEVLGSETPRAGTTFLQARPPTPPQAIELKPFNHQVGGHTALYRFSRRAICKKLNNRENKFYETVERFHPELLDYLPR